MITIQQIEAKAANQYGVVEGLDCMEYRMPAAVDRSSLATEAARLAIRSAERERLSLARFERPRFSSDDEVALSKLGALLDFTSESDEDSNALSTAEKASVAGSLEEFLFFAILNTTFCVRTMPGELRVS